MPNTAFDATNPSFLKSFVPEAKRRPDGSYSTVVGLDSAGKALDDAKTPVQAAEAQAAKFQISRLRLNQLKEAEMAAWVNYLLAHGEFYRKWDAEKNSDVTLSLAEEKLDIDSPALLAATAASKAAELAARDALAVGWRAWDAWQAAKDALQKATLNFFEEDDKLKAALAAAGSSPVSAVGQIMSTGVGASFGDIQAGTHGRL